ncbi:MAG: aminoglycoside phosphotransferase family protein [Anaerolineae bacterium]|nr:aminoglycoside phosphotransferase family protein [Anaerolineae bacterium]
MYSLSKTTISSEAIQDIVRHHFGCERTIDSFEELTDGLFNAAFRVELDDGLNCVLKVAPADDVRVMRYEKNIMQAEVEVMRLVGAQTDLPVPEIYFYDPSRQIIDNDFYGMAFIPGTPLNKLRKDLTDAEQQTIDREAGQLTRQINAVRGSHFGYYADVEHPTQPDDLFSSWREAFGAMLSGVLADGIEMGVDLSVPYDELQDRLVSFYHVLDEIVVPQLVHWDLWDGNIFVDPTTKRINGVVDFERALWGDPLMECLFGFRDPHSAYAEGYGGQMLVTNEQICRRTLYNIYLYLIMVIECAYRQYETQDQENWARSQLLKELSGLGSVDI